MAIIMITMQWTRTIKDIITKIKGQHQISKATNSKCLNMIKSMARMISNHLERLIIIIRIL